MPICAAWLLKRVTLLADSRETKNFYQRAVQLDRKFAIAGHGLSRADTLFYVPTAAVP